MRIKVEFDIGIERVVLAACRFLTYGKKSTCIVCSFCIRDISIQGYLLFVKQLKLNNVN